ncbi:MAG TPA: MBL fold metallo-hydrolase [Acidimicrobiia bacterium]|nr:MBL fold metallo-hydrolase [Acidimicrobiia bacterium]
MRLSVLGSNGTYPTPGRPASGYLVVSGETTLLLDIGPGVFPALLAAGRLPDAILISHAHSDHCVDLLALFNYLRFDATDGWGIPVLAPPGVVDRLAAFVGAGPGHDFFRALRASVVEPGTAMDIGEVTLRFGATTHPVPAVCTRIEARGRVIVYSGDTGPGGDLPRLATGADLLLCEATNQGEPGPDRYPYHLFAVEAGAVAREAAVRTLVVTHVGPLLDPAISVAEAAAVFAGPVRHAEPGLEVAL